MFTPFEMRGVGIHTGARCAIRIFEGRDPGIDFETPDGRIHLQPEAIDPASNRATDLRCGKARVRTVEHLLAALCAFGNSCFRVEVDGPEIPALDGSAIEWVGALEAAGASRGLKMIEVPGELTVTAGQSRGTLLPLSPGEEPVYRIELDYGHAWPLPEDATFRPLSEDLATELAPARTYALAEEVAGILEAGMGQGGSLDNAIIIAEDGPVGDTELRFRNEPARHKLLDAIGDIYTTGGLPRGHLNLHMPGHRLNHKLALALVAETRSLGDVR